MYDQYEEGHAQKEPFDCIFWEFINAKSVIRKFIFAIPKSPKYYTNEIFIYSLKSIDLDRAIARYIRLVYKKIIKTYETSKVIIIQVKSRQACRVRII